MLGYVVQYAVSIVHAHLMSLKLEKFLVEQKGSIKPKLAHSMQLHKQ